MEGTQETTMELTVIIRYRMIDCAYDEARPNHETPDGKVRLKKGWRIYRIKRKGIRYHSWLGSNGTGFASSVASDVARKLFFWGHKINLSA